MTTGLKYIDIGANLTDPQFQGIYRGKQKHPADFDAVLERAKAQGVTQMLVTGSDLIESLTAQKLAQDHPNFLYATTGVHPCQAADPAVCEPGYFEKIEQAALEGAKKGLVKAYGEFGLDYDRLHYAPADRQKEVFQIQLDIASRLRIPLFLHSRACENDFYEMLAPYIEKYQLKGVVHSFTGSVDEMNRLLGLGLYIGINGCSLKTPENLEVVKKVPLDRLLLETDAPWCEIRRTHASSEHTSALPFETVPKPERWQEGKMIRGRCEPCAMPQVAEVVAAIRDEPLEKIAEAAYTNGKTLFGM